MTGQVARCGQAPRDAARRAGHKLSVLRQAGRAYPAPGADYATQGVFLTLARRFQYTGGALVPQEPSGQHGPAGMPSGSASGKSPGRCRAGIIPHPPGCTQDLPSSTAPRPRQGIQPRHAARHGHASPGKKWNCPRNCRQGAAFTMPLGAMRTREGERRCRSASQETCQGAPVHSRRGVRKHERFLPVPRACLPPAPHAPASPACMAGIVRTDRPSLSSPAPHWKETR